MTATPRRPKPRGQARRHSWGEPNRHPAVTIRTCRHCGLMKHTRHEPDHFPPHWTEFWRGTDKVVPGQEARSEATGTKKNRTPACAIPVDDDAGEAAI